MKNFYRLVVFVLFVSATFSVNAQNGMPVKIAVFTPLYLNQAFEGSNYKLGKANLPKNILPGLEFYNGVMLALDSLKQEGTSVQVNIYDSKQDASSLDRILKGPELENTGLIIAAITTTAELKMFGDIAQKRSIPLVSATFPNYVGINQNPYFILLNSSFNAHLEGIYKYMVRNYPLNEIIAIKKPGSTEDYIKKQITELNRNAAGIPIKMRWVDVSENFSASSILPYLDSTRNNVVFVASPLESFGVNVVKALSNLDSYSFTAVGMPTWDGVRALNNRDFDNVELIYSTPFNYSNNEALNAKIKSIYREKFYSRPSDMVYRGFESTFHFTKLLSKYGTRFLNNLSADDFTIFNNFDIQPVKLKKTNSLPDFLENKKLYFVKKREGQVLSIY